VIGDLVLSFFPLLSLRRRREIGATLSTFLSLFLLFLIRCKVCLLIFLYFFSGDGEWRVSFLPHFLPFFVGARSFAERVLFLMPSPFYRVEGEKFFTSLGLL